MAVATRSAARKAVRKRSRKLTVTDFDTVMESQATRRALELEAPDWGEPIREAPESRIESRAEAPDAGEGEPHGVD